MNRQQFHLHLLLQNEQTFIRKNYITIHCQTKSNGFLIEEAHRIFNLLCLVRLTIEKIVGCWLYHQMFFMNLNIIFLILFGKLLGRNNYVNKMWEMMPQSKVTNLIQTAWCLCGNLVFWLAQKDFWRLSFTVSRICCMENLINFKSEVHSDFEGVWRQRTVFELSLNSSESAKFAVSYSMFAY